MMLFRNLNIYYYIMLTQIIKREDTLASGMVKGRFGPDA